MSKFKTIFKELSCNDRYEDEFKQIERIGKGTFGKVYKVFHKEEEKYYAIKQVDFHEYYFDKTKDKFQDECLNEIRFMETLKEDYVVHYIRSWSEGDDMFYIQMELCCAALDDILQQLRKEFKQITSETISIIKYYISSDLFRETVEALNYLHQQNPPIIHRDLKPENILITDGLNGRFVKLADFGLSTLHEFYGQSHTEDKGTLKYMAPEVGQGRHYDTKADIYSLGLISRQIFNLSAKTSTEDFLTKKYESVQNLLTEMTSGKENIQKRPNCQQILDSEKVWYLDIKILNSDSNYRNIIESKHEESMKQCFHKYFIHKRHLRSGSEEINELLRNSNEAERDDELDLSYNSHLILEKVRPGFSYEGRYKRQFAEKELLGKGCFGTVYKVFHSTENKFYAIKKINFKASHFTGSGDDFIEKSLDEIKVMGRLRSDYVVYYITSWFEDEMMFYIQMELCYESLHHVSKQLKVEFNRKTFETMSRIECYILNELFNETVKALNYLHQQNPPIIHRDLKPENILISYGLNGRFVKLADFGLSVFHERDQSHTLNIGDIRYTAPEVGNGRKYDTRADIYSLGVVAQQLFGIEINEDASDPIDDLLITEMYKSLRDLIVEMKSENPQGRPDCQQILNKENILSNFNKEMLNSDSHYQEIINSTDYPTIEDCFYKYFIRKKQIFEPISASKKTPLKCVAL